MGRDPGGCGGGAGGEGARDHPQEHGSADQERQSDRGGPRCRAEPHRGGVCARCRRRCRAGDRGGERAGQDQVCDFRGAGSRDAPDRDFGLEHVVDLHHGDRGPDIASRQGDWDALHESGADDAVGGSHPGAGHIRRDHEGGRGSGDGLGQDAGRGERLPGIRGEPDSPPDDQRGGLLRHGGCGGAGGGRHGDEARDEPPDGTAGAGGPDRSGRLSLDPGGLARRSGRPEVPAVPAAAEDGGRGPAGPQDRPRVL